MIIIPKGKPVVQNLNSFYLVINKMIEHFQGELGSGCVHFSSSSDEGLIFFDKDDLLNGVLKNSNGETIGDAAIKQIIRMRLLFRISRLIFTKLIQIRSIFGQIFLMQKKFTAT